MPTTDAAATLRRQLHAHCLLSGLSFADIARQLGQDKQWVKTRVCPPAAGRARGRLTVDDVDDICRAIGVEGLTRLLAPALHLLDEEVLQRSAAGGVSVASSRRVAPKATWDRLLLQGYLAVSEGRYRLTPAGEGLLRDLSTAKTPAEAPAGSNP